MLTRFLGGVAVCVGAAGGLSAQQPAPVKPAKAAPAVRLARAVVDTPATTLPAATPTAAPAMVPTTVGSDLLANGGASMTSCPTYGDCPAPATACCTPCGPLGRFWVDAGYVFWTTSGMNVPPLVTSAPVGTPRAIAGALGQPTTTILYPTKQINNQFRSGFYLNAGIWLDECQTIGIEGNFFYLGDSNNRFTAGSDGSQVLTRPFFNTNLNRPDTQLVSFPDTQLVSTPGILAGSVTVNSNTSLIGGGANFVKNLCCGPCGRFDLLLGYSYLGLSDEINIREDLTSLPGQTNVVPGTRFIVNDNFRTTNDFHGVNIGFATERRYSHWYVGVRAGVALGVNHQVVEIDGFTTITPPGGPTQTFAGGLLTQPSNIGRYTRDEFAVMPWVGAKLGCQITPRLRTYIGYDFMYLNNVVRAGDQIDLRVDPNQIPTFSGANRTPGQFPAFQFRETGLTVQGIRVGLEFRY